MKKNTGNSDPLNDKRREAKTASLPCFSANTLIIGSGTAALNAAVHLFDYGQEDILIATDNWGGGTSHNTGSDKQTYYKLSLSGDRADSPRHMAEDLFRGGCMHGDIALCEALNSLPAFFHLVKLGVPFPHDRFGAYIGYKTDHDPRQRATSAGPLTSQMMFKALARAVADRGIRVLNNHQVFALLVDAEKDEKRVVGALALNTGNFLNTDPGNPDLVLFNAVNVVLGTGGPAGMYLTSVYPESQLGSTGMALEIGAVGHNLTESQFGLASTAFRWNLSGSYQQVIPRYISLDPNGTDEQEFLNDHFPDMTTLASAIFMKGYQWPFDPRKVKDYGSSLIDILVYREIVRKKRRVFLDFSRNPGGQGKFTDFSLEQLKPEAYDYLARSGALLDTPIARLQKMNQPAIDLYAGHGIDLAQDFLEIAVCVQHNNGGLKGNIWWESNIKHLFPVGEVSGTHGVYRPGGSALNSGQVGSMRAALFIARRYSGDPPPESAFRRQVHSQVVDKMDFIRNSLSDTTLPAFDLESARKEMQQRMTVFGAHIRHPEQIGPAVRSAWALYVRMHKEMKISSRQDLPDALRALDLCLTHALYLEAIQEYLAQAGKSRGSFLVLDQDGEKPCSSLEDEWKFSPSSAQDFVNNRILEIGLSQGDRVNKNWVKIRPIPEDDAWFENIWNEYLHDHIIR